MTAAQPKPAAKRTAFDVLKTYNEANKSLKPTIVTFKEQKYYLCQETGKLIKEKVCFTSPDGKRQLGCFCDVGALGKWLEDCGGITQEDRNLIEEEATYESITLESEMRAKELKAASMPTKADSEVKTKPWVCHPAVSNPLGLDSHAIRVKNVGDAINQLILRNKVNVGSEIFTKQAIGFQVDLSPNHFVIRSSPSPTSFPDATEHAFRDVQTILVADLEISKLKAEINAAKAKKAAKPKAEPKPKAPKRKAAAKPKGEPRPKKTKKVVKFVEESLQPKLEEGEIIEHMPSVTTKSD